MKENSKKAVKENSDSEPVQNARCTYDRSSNWPLNHGLFQ